MFKDKLQISRERLEFYYSIAVLIIIPLLIAGNTLLMINGVRKSTDAELRRKADLANSVLSAVIGQQLDDRQQVQNTVEAVTKTRDELANITVVVPRQVGEDYEIIASKVAGKIGEVVNTLQYSLVASSKNSIAQLIETNDGRVWNVVSPVFNSNGNVAALVNLDVSLKQADSLISSLLLRSIVVMAVTVMVVVLLLVNHFRFVEYAMLFRKLKELDQLKSDFLSVATHELRAPMAVIKGNIENIVDGFVGSADDKVKAVLKDMHNETERLNTLVSDLLNVSHIEQGRITYQLEPVSVTEVVQEVVSQFQDKATAKGLILSYQPLEKPYFINVDKGRFIEIMTNLIDNAIKYSKKGTVTVSHKVKPNAILTSVHDTGIGMSAKDREKLFSRFYRIQNEETRNIGGTGLGLWIIKQYIEHMHGSINVDSLQGVGSEFTVEFPITEPASPSSK